MFYGAGGFGAQAVALRGYAADFNALGGLFVQQLRNGCRAALAAYAFDNHHTPQLRLHNDQRIANLNFFGWFYVVLVELHASERDFIRRQRPCFEEPSRPKPFVYANFVHVFIQMGVEG
ncbi:MAG: hypothetical protein RLZ68_989 [Pseudomonadota bacterium]